MRNLKVITGVVALGLAAVSMAFVVVHHYRPKPVAVVVTLPKASASPTPTPVLNPLEIKAIQSRSYVASAITTEQTLSDQGGYSTSVVSFTSDGFKENALLAAPNSARPAGGYPVIVFVHGYIPPSTYRTVSSAYRDWIATWARAGYTVIVPDLRGNGSSQGDADSGHFSPTYTYDVLNLVASLKGYGQVDPTRIGVAGHSMGGHIALRVAVASSDIKTTVLINGVTGSMYDIWYNWPHSPATYDQPTAAIQSEHQALVAQNGTPATNPSFWAQASAINYVAQLTGSIMVNHDTADSVVPFAFSQKLVDALNAAHKTVTFATYPGDDHQLNSSGNHALMLQRTTEWWLAHL